MNGARFLNAFFLRQIAGVAFLFILLICSVGSLSAQEAASCAGCHDQGPKLAKSAHAGLSCDTCHEGREKYPHPAGLAMPACATCHEDQSLAFNRGVHGQAAKNGGAAPDCSVCHGSAHELLKPGSPEFRAAAPDTCAMCHADQVKDFQASVHGQALARGVSQAPLCTDCHGEHSIQKHTSAASPVFKGNVRETCGSCHDNVRLSRKFGLPTDRLVSFDASFHGLAAKAGSQTVANCASCHGVHNILKSTDPKATTNAKNLGQTCGSCHPGAGKRFAIGQVHVVEGANEPSSMRWVRQFYLLVIPLTLVLMLLHQGGDFVRKVIRLRARNAPPYGLYRGRQVRMFPLERLQHGVMAISFILLVVTGFALKYPDQWWARPMMGAEGLMRGVAHRAAAVVFMAVSMLHVISLIASRRLRNHWKELLPKVSDVREGSTNMAYNLGLRKTRPYRSAHSYIEKAEYWAVIWGSGVMILTGVMLWANNLMLAMLPKSWLDVATSVHFYEAVLATASIVIWHFYTVIFDPEVYPIDTAFLTGTSVRVHEHEETPAEVEVKAESAAE
ncbi:MAG TPA: cytochrome b/b6 domain-containing protein [Bryobacteraceae bacterium]|nr:cytochrome b/b6 domain-containing protein [Bryobacteraceae bacterium]